MLMSGSKTLLPMLPLLLVYFLHACVRTVVYVEYV